MHATCDRKDIQAQQCWTDNILMYSDHGSLHWLEPT